MITNEETVRYQLKIISNNAVKRKERRIKDGSISCWR